jgi:molybdate transport system ATP-binding protein
MLSVRIRKALGDFTLDLSLSAGNEACALLGASGSGKSMALKAIAGIIRPDEGRIELDGEVLYDSERRVCLSPRDRRTGLMFQHYALFPNMNVEENILCGLNRLKRDRRRARAAELIERMRLTGQARLYPAQLSGGERQRVALARMLASEPRLIMLDEPFSALDSHLRWQLEREVSQLLRDFSGTALMVSHNRDEAFRLCDRIAVLDAGRVSAVGERQALFDRPGTRAAAVMTGCKNVTRAEKAGPHRLTVPGWGARLDTRDPVDDGVRWVGVRARQITAAPGDTAGANRLPWTLISHIEGPFSHILMVACPGGAEPIRWELSREAYAALPNPSRGVLEIPKDRVHPLTD